MSVLKIKNAQGEWQEVPFIKGDKGDKGDTYVLTEEDKEDIAGLVDIPIQIKYVKDDESDNGGVIEGLVELPTDVTLDVNAKINKATGENAHAEGGYLSYSGSGNNKIYYLYGTEATGQASHAEGANTHATTTCSHAEGYGTTASGINGHAEGTESTASGVSSHVEGKQSKSVGEASHAEGYKTISNGKYSHTEGSETQTSAEGYASHAEGHTTTASGAYSHSEGRGTVASSFGSHAEGFGSVASGQFSHAENRSQARGDSSHAENTGTASGNYSHAEGYDTIASGYVSHAEGQGTIAKSSRQHVEGKYNIEDTNNTYAHIVGNGRHLDDRSNAYTLDWQGNGVYSGKLTVGKSPTEDMDVATKKYVDDIKGASIHICSSEEYDSTTRVPTIQNPDERTFYLVPSEDGTSPDLFVEWAYVNNAWEMFGSASIDLSGYLTDVTVGGNSVVTNGVAEIPVASRLHLGAIKVDSDASHSGLSVDNTTGFLELVPAIASVIKNGSNSHMAISPSRQHEATFYGLAKASGDSTQSASSNAVGTYTDEAKASIQTMLGVPSVDDIPDVPVEDIQINGTSILTDGVANVPIGGSNIVGAYSISESGRYGLIKNNTELRILPADDGLIKNPFSFQASDTRPIPPKKQHNAVFYGLAKAAGADESNSTLPLGNYTPEAKGAIQSMLGIDSLIAPTETNPFTNTHEIGDLFIINGTLYKAKTAIAIGDVLDDGVNVEGVNVDDVLGDYVKNTDYATTQNYGLVKVGNGLSINGNTGAIGINPASVANVKAGTNQYLPLTSEKASVASFYGLAKASGDTTQSASSNPIGQYTDEAKASIKTMLGVEDPVVDDVQINGTSILSDGVANIPVASATAFGAVKVISSYGVQVSNGILAVQQCTENMLKNPSSSSTSNIRPVTADLADKAAFYGLAKASGDTTQSQSSNPVGQYTDEAKTSIKQMLGVVDSYDSLVVNVTGTDPVITGSPSYRYNCGEVASLTVTPPTSGTIDIIFTSGTTPTVLDLPQTVKMPSWWIGVEANTIYEICITDATYCGVMSWDV